VLLLDEPTSGLDSASAYSVMLRLQAMAKAGHAIMCTIHQPSSELWSLFDKFILLSGGHTIYNGRADQTVQYFGNLGHACPVAYNPADYVLALVNQDFPDRYDDSLPGKYTESEQRSATLAAVAEAIEAGKANPIDGVADYGLKSRSRRSSRCRTASYSTTPATRASTGCGPCLLTYALPYKYLLTKLLYSRCVSSCT
jgi:ABC-type multidrug transport system ATPase subunit